ncbi:MAG: hypothetical protein KF802_09320 [Bdellovibrionaceae bacterium]|nr:hypothetical protein [Pseudobdellovibrionaceae bacterium]MBX3033684.1 hypothetical protein [Pseudobdellovibrionaceae bacterium]
MGKEISEQVLQNTGLPENLIRNEFESLLKRHGLSEETLTLDALRDVLADYLQDIFTDPRNRHS